jgi:MoaA/NifB/PqqE/SkfB family radical SAM enzyme
MKTLELEITDSCNEKCLHCFHCEIRKNKFIKNLDKLDKMLGEFGDLGFMQLIITGGEPLLHPQFKEICKLAQKNRYLISVKTNGTLIDDGLVEFFKELKPKSIVFSIYSADQNEHDSITQTPGSFQETIKNLITLKENSIKVAVLVPVLKGINKWKEVAEIMKDLDIKVGFGYNIQSSFDYRDEVEQFKGDFDYYLDFFEFINKFEDQKKNNIEEKCFKACKGAILTAAVAPDYSVRACISYPDSAGIYTGGNAEELLKKARTQLEERFAKLECHNCELVKYCNPCPAHMKIVDGVGICEQTKKEYVKAYLKYFHIKS